MNAYSGDGWKRLQIATNEHIREIEQRIGGTRSAAIAQAVRAFRQALEQPDFTYPEHTQHFRDYTDFVAQAKTVPTTIYMTDETEADLQAIGKWFEEKRLLQLLKATRGYNRRMLIYMALRWYEAYLAG